MLKALLWVFDFYLPALKSTIALRQANSAGSTPTERYLCSTSLSIRTSAAIWLALPLGTVARCSETLNRGLVSSGRHHCTALSRNSSAQHSSSKITWGHGIISNQNFFNWRHILLVCYILDKVCNCFVLHCIYPRNLPCRLPSFH